MTDYRHGAHSVFSIHLHLVWVTKYRKPILTGEIALRARDLLREVCGQQEATILKGHVSKDHVHLLVSVPPSLTVSRLVQRLKGKSAYKLMEEFPHLRKKFWGQHRWARGYFCCSSGNVTDDIIKEYIEHQLHGEGSDFSVEGEGSPSGEAPSA